MLPPPCPIVTTLPVISVSGYFTSNIMGSIEGNMVPFCKAPDTSYAYCEYPDVVPALFDIDILFTVWTPEMLSNKVLISLNSIGWLICHLFVEKKIL